MSEIFLIGYMASGKTTFGKALSRYTGRSFIDLNFYIERRFHTAIQRMVVPEMEYALGRAAKTYYPVTLPFDTEKRPQVSDPAAETPSITVYDALDRVVRSVLPDGSVTRTAYRVDQSLNAALATVTDALGNRSATLTDGNGNILRAVRYAEGGNIVTSFEYDGLGRMTRVTDADSNVTKSKYDLGGRRISVSHPASGLTAFEYDPLGNMVSRQTPRLRKIGKKIEYGYEFGRLVSITYPPEDGQPVNPDNVTLSYGGNNAMHNRRGRLEMRVDGSGAEEFFYGRRGEVVKSRRTYIVPNQTVATYETQWSYDCLGRLLSMTYPDNETVRYSYDLGGNLRAVSGDKFYKYKYVDSIAYDRFGQRRLMYYGNGTVTSYGYDLNRRLDSLRVTSQSDSVPLMENAYKFDAVGNVTGIAGSAASPSGAAAAVSHTFGYDKLYRLTSAQGAYAGTAASYTLGMGYDNMHRVVSKSLRLAQDGVQSPGSLKTGYDLAYSYSREEGRRFRLDSVADSHYRTAGGSAAATIRDTHSYGYDADGNMDRVSTARTMSDGTPRGGFFGRGIIWDPENRMLASCDNGFVTTYLYDAGGNRTVKQSGGSMHLHVDSEHTAGETATEGFSLYVGPWMTVNQDRRYTKHIYAGSRRIVSKVGDVSSFSSSTDDPRGVLYVGKDKATGVDSIGTRGRYAVQTARVGGLYAKFGVPYGGRDNNVYPDEVPEPAPQRSAGSLAAWETGRFFHHPDHLGSSSRVTDRNGKVVQAVEYVPFGEVFLDLRNSDWGTPYLFNAKELDGETGLYYYGARYYDPRLCLWLSTDPLQEKYPDVCSYCYALDNPVKLMDPDGQEVVIWYDDDHDRRQSFKFSGFHGQKSITIPKNQYVRDFIQAYLYNARNGGGQKTIQAVTNPKYKIDVSNTMRPGSNYDWKNRIVFWKPRTGIITSDDGRISPATTLEHEMDHAVDHIDNPSRHENRRRSYDSQYVSKEERRVITGSERKTARGNKEAIRKNHIGKSYKTVSSTSTEPLK